uniref:Uncharacterized protein n=1 Tax=Salix viminalis TaxID=40686 RepID=A0A6N2LGS6_SALVM
MAFQRAGSMVFPLSSSLSSIKVVPGVFASKTKEHIIYIFWRRRRRRRGYSLQAGGSHENPCSNKLVLAVVHAQ